MSLALSNTPAGALRDGEPDAFPVLKIRSLESLRRVWTQLEAGQENWQDGALWTSCAAEFSQWREDCRRARSMGLVELAGLLERACLVLREEGQIATAMELAEAVGITVLRLNRYLDLLDDNHFETATLLSEINALRKNLGDSLLTEISLFSLVEASLTEAAAVAVPMSPNGEPPTTNLAKVLKPAFQTALAGLLKDQEPLRQIERIGKVASKLLESSTDTRLASIWWISAGYAEALAAGNLPLNDNSSGLLAKLEPLISQLAETGELKTPPVIAQEIVLPMLFALGRCQPAGVIARTVVEKLALDQRVSSQDLLKTHRKYCIGPSQEVWHALADACIGELTMVKASLKAQSGLPEVKVTDIASLHDTLGQVSKVFGVANLTKYQETIHQLLSTLGANGTATVVSGQALEAAAQEINTLEKQLRRLPAIPDENEIEITADLIESDNSVVEPKIAATSLELSLEELSLETAKPTDFGDSFEATNNGIEITLEPLPPDSTNFEVSVSSTLAVENKPVAPVTLPSTPSSPIAVANQALLPVLVETVDQEILDIFLEEAAEIKETLATYLPRWQASESDYEALVEVRRAYHTLKGSGRMAGAPRIGEFAWSIEHLLNRVLDQTLPVTPIIVNFIVQATALIPPLLAQIKGGPAPAADIATLMAQAHAWANNETPVAAAVTMTAPAPAPTLTPPDNNNLPSDGSADEFIELSSEIIEETPTLQPHIDQQLYEIFSQECLTHLNVIDQCLASTSHWPMPAETSKNLYRTLHTLKGSAYMAEISGIAELSQRLDRLIRMVADMNGTVGSKFIDLLKQGRQAIYDELMALADINRPLPNHQALSQQLDDLVGHLVATTAEPPTATTTAPEQIPVLTTAAAITSAQMQSPPRLADEHGNTTLPALDPALTGLYLEESEELLGNLETGLNSWRANLADFSTHSGMLRDLHTLKGGARMVGVTGMADVIHETESLLKLINDGGKPATDVDIQLLLRAVDRLNNGNEQLRAGVNPPTDIELLAALRGEPVNAIQPKADVATPVTLTRVEPATPVEIPGEVILSTAPAEPILLTRLVRQPEENPIKSREEVVRIASTLLDTLLNRAGELGIFHSRLNQQSNTLGFNLNELGQTVTRLRGQLRQLELETEAQMMNRRESVQVRDETGQANEDFDPLEFDRYTRVQQLSRSLSESVSDLNSLKDLLDTLRSEIEVLLQQQSRVTVELQDALIRTRMVPFSTYSHRFSRLTRQTAEAVNKQAHLELIGGQEELDRDVLDRMIAPIEHMIRNAIAHGLEKSEDRTLKGKTNVGQIRLSVSREGSHIILIVEDDGAGLDLAAIRRRGIERGLIAANAKVSDEVLIQLILKPGFSTAEKVTQVSGRGVGMDVVEAEIKQLGGSLIITSQPGRGTRFSVRLPYTLAMSRVLLVRVGDENYAITADTVKGVVRLSTRQARACLQGEITTQEYAGETYSIELMADWLNASSRTNPEESQGLALLLIQVGSKRHALAVDQLLENCEVVVKTAGKQLASVTGVAGATIMGDGRVVLIIDPIAMMNAFRHRASPESVAVATSRPTIMVVDDSITVRRVTTRFLEREGMNVLTARDGIEAITVLQDNQPDIMLLDIEMPRMDGFELASHLRKDPQFASLPIIMITSRVGDKHRMRASELGVNEYLGKPYQEPELLGAIQRLLEKQNQPKQNHSVQVEI